MAGKTPLRKIEDWKDAWDKNDIAFHKPDVHKMLQKHSSLLNPEGKELKFFVPLCGKTLDMKWMLDQGHALVGVEAAKKALDDFFTEHGLDCTEEDAPSLGPECKVLKNKDGKLKLYCCDLFLFNKSIEGQVDCIWDRGSLVALNREDVKRYAELLKEILKPGGKMLLETFEYDLALFEGLERPPPPHPMFEEEVRSLFEPDCVVEMVDRASRLLGGKDAELAYYLIVKK